MPRLSLCMVVRDEAQRLPRALASFADLADEIIVVDTGSKDGTSDVARAHGARVEPYVWDDDFSGPRNRSFDIATGEWVFVLDADESILPESRDDLEALLGRTDAEGFTVLRRDHTPGGFSEMRFPRLVRRSTGVRLVGRIHEHPDRPIGRVIDSDVVIEHTGYLGDPAAKRKRNRPLLEKELRERPGQLYYEADLAYLLVRDGDAEWPAHLRRIAAKLDKSAPRAPVPTMEPLLETALLAPEVGLAAEADGMAARWYPDSVPLLVARARLAFMQDDVAKAAELGSEAWRLWESRTYRAGISFDPGLLGPEFRLNLGVALARADRLEESLSHFDSVPEGVFAAPARANAAAIRKILLEEVRPADHPFE